MKRLISIILCITLCLSLCSVFSFADPEDGNDPPPDLSGMNGETSDSDGPGGQTDGPGGETDDSGGQTEGPGGQTEGPGGQTEGSGGQTDPGGEPENPPVPGPTDPSDPINPTDPTIVDQGICGTNLTWTLDTAGKLVISGTGTMDDYLSSDTTSVWKMHATEIYSVIIGSNITNVGSNAFCGCLNLTHVELPDSIESLDIGAFRRCSSLEELDIPSGVKKIRNSAFSSCSSLKSLRIPAGVTYFGTNACLGCTSLTRVTIPSGLTTFGDSPFSGCTGLKSAGSIDSSCDIQFGWVTEIPKSAFWGCSALLDVQLPSTITEIGEDAFHDCISLASIVIPAGVTSIGAAAFCDCSQLKDVYYEGTSAQWKKVSIAANNNGLDAAEIHCIDSGINHIPTEYRIDAAYSIYPYQNPAGTDPSAVANASGVVLTGTTVQTTASCSTITASLGTGGSAATVSEELKLYIQGPLPYAVSLVKTETVNSGNITEISAGMMRPKIDYEVDGGTPSVGSSHTVRILSEKLLQLDPADWAVVLFYMDQDHPVYIIEYFTMECETSVELVSIDDVQKNYFQYTLALSAGSELADQRYGIGVEVCNRSDFTNGSGTYRFTSQNTERSGSCFDPAIQLDTGFSAMVPGVTYYVRAVLVDLSTHENFVTGKENRSFTVSDSLIPFTDMVLNQPVSVLGSTEIDAKFTAASSGLYAFCTDSNVNWVEVLSAGGWITGYAHQPENGRGNLYASFYLAAGETAYFNCYSIDDTVITVVSADAVMKQLVPGTPLAADSGEAVCFKAPESGYYNFSYANTTMQYDIQQFDLQTGKWYNGPQVYGRRFNKGETVYLKPTYNQALTGQLSLLASAVSLPDQDLIEVSSAYSVTNRSMTVDFTLSVTADTANKGYSVGFLFGADPELKNGTSRAIFKRYYAARNQETITLSLNNYVPSQWFYYRAILITDPEELKAIGAEIRFVQFDPSLYGFEQLTLGTPYHMVNQGQALLYFEAQSEGMYMVSAEQVSSINMKDNGGGPIVGESGRNSYQYGTYMKAGEKIFITTGANSGMHASLTVFDGQTDHPVALLGTQSIYHQLPMLFTAPEEGEYRFSVDNEAGLCIINANGNPEYQGLYYHAWFAKGQSLWVYSSFNPSLSVHLTIEKGVFPKSVLTFPESLTELGDEACKGLNIEEAVFGSQIRKLGRECFANCPDLQRIVIPVADVDIADDAFLHSSVTFVAPAGGSVEAYAKSHFQVNFETLNSAPEEGGHPGAEDPV